MGLIVPERPYIWFRLSFTMMLEKSCLLCRNVWEMHHRCPALNGRWNCC